MTAADRSPVFLDTNVLVCANLALSPFHKAATGFAQKVALAQKSAGCPKSRAAPTE
jgi:hypothetical protein